jgi:uncharacterized protein (DUF433 family)
MSLDMAHAHIEKLGNEPARLRRTPRVRVAQIVMDYLAYGWSVDEMCRHHPYLSPSEAHAAMAYYFDHQDEIEAEVSNDLKEAAESAGKAAPPPFVGRVHARGLL